MYNIDIQKMFREEQAKLKACKTKEDLNELYRGRIVRIQDGGDWDGEVCEFVEMVGSGERTNWRMKVKTRFNTFLELKPGEFMMIMQQIKTTPEEADKIKKHLESKYGDELNRA